MTTPPTDPVTDRTDDPILDPGTRSTIEPATGTLGVLLPGLGAVASTFVAGVLAARHGATPIGSLSQLDRIRLRLDDHPVGAGPNGRRPAGPGRGNTPPDPLIRDVVPLAGLGDLVFGGWDPISPNLLEAARTAGVLEERDIAPVSRALEGVVGMDAVFDQEWVSRLEGQRVKPITSKYDQAQALIDDIERFRVAHGCDRLVAVWCGSTEAYQEPSEVHASLDAFEHGLKHDDPNISPSQIYAYALLQSGVPHANGAPNLSLDIPAMVELAELRRVPIAGKDFKTGQTFMKTLLAPGFRARMLGVEGWYSTNILGNRDGEVLDAPENFKSKEVSKLGVLDTILEPELYGELYGDIDHVVRINYYRPRGDNKEGWDNIDIFGWMNYPMQIKVNFLCRDSILAAPLVLDLVLFLDLAARAGACGVQEWLSFYFKCPQPGPTAPDPHDVVHELAAQRNMLKNELRRFLDLPAIPYVSGG